jgi:hypothetical protein
MKCIKIFIVSVFITLILSCCDDNVWHRYYKAFYLGEDNVTISGTVFNEALLTTLANYETIHAIINPDIVEGWKVTGTKNGNKFEIVLKKSSNGVVLSTETINKSDHIASIEFCIDDNIYPYTLGGPIYEEQKNGRYDYFYYHYVYVAEPIDLSTTKTVEGYDFLGYEETIHYYYDYNFDKVGWYKICTYYPMPIGNDPKHSSGSNTYLHK